MFAKEEYESAIVELLGLIHDQPSSEAAFQAYFERHLLALRVLGYSVVRPHVRLPLAAGESFVPDFLAQKPEGQWDVVEIKPFDLHILRRSKKRQGFYSEVERYIAQTIEYAKWFTDQSNRNHLTEKYDLSSGPNVGRVLIGGCPSDSSQVRINELAVERAGNLTIYTYQTVLERLEQERARHFGYLENAPGIAVAASIKLPHTESHNAILSIGDFKLGTLLRLYAETENVITAEIQVQGEVAVKTQLQVPITDLGIVILVEATNVSGGTYVSITSSGGPQRWSFVSLNASIELSLTDYVVGAGKESETSHFRMVENVVFDRTLSFEERIQLLMYMQDKAENSVACVEFSGRQYLASGTC